MVSGSYNAHVSGEGLVLTGAHAGEIMSVSVLGRPMVFVNSAKVAADLFEKRSSNYSDRTPLHMINDLCLIPPFNCNF